MHYSTQSILVFFSFLPALVPLIVGIVRFKKLHRPLNYLAVLVMADFLTEIVERVYWISSTPNLFLWPIYISVEFGLIAWIYRYELKPMFISRAMPMLIGLFICFIFITWFKWGSSNFNPIQRFIESVLVIYFALAFFYKTLKNLVAMHLERQPMFWLSTGLFIYFSGDIIIFIFSSYLLSYSKQFNLNVWILHAILNIVLYIFYTLALCLTPKKQI